MYRNSEISRVKFTHLKVLGRKLDLLYDTKGTIISEYLAAKIWSYGDFKQIQFIQKEKRNIIFV